MFDEGAKARFASLFSKNGDDECWPWLGQVIKKDGRGIFWFDGKRMLAPRYALSAIDGVIRPPSTFACHTCDNPNCVNPKHLWWGDAKKNSVDASSKGRVRGQSITHCKRGHELSGENAAPNNGGSGRKCRICQRMHNRAYETRSDAHAKKMERQRKRRAVKKAALSEARDAE